MAQELQCKVPAKRVQTDTQPETHKCSLKRRWEKNEQKPPKMSINWRGEKENIPHPCNAMLASSKEEWNTGLFQNMNTPQKHYVK